MPNVDLMMQSQKSMLAAIDEVMPLLPDAMQKDLAAKRETLRLQTDKAAEEAIRIERNRPQMSGTSYDAPRARDVAGYTYEKISINGANEVHYSRGGPDGANGSLAFVDKGRQVLVQDWTNEDSVRAAMKLSSEKWDAITLTGNARYKDMAIRIAAENGYTIANSELQDRLVQEKARLQQQQPTNVASSSPRDPATAPPLTKTAAERQLALEEIRERVVIEARRETRQANAASALGEDNSAMGEAAHPYRSQADAEAAQQAARAENNNPNRPMPANPSQSQAIIQAKFDQEKILNQEANEAKSPMEQIREKSRQEARKATEQDYGQEM